MIDLKLSWKLHTSARQGYGPKYELGNVTKEPNNLARCQALNNHQNGCSVCHTACLCYSLDDSCWLYLFICPFDCAILVLACSAESHSATLCVVFSIEIIWFASLNWFQLSLKPPTDLRGGLVNRATWLVGTSTIRLHYLFCVLVFHVTNK